MDGQQHRPAWQALGNVPQGPVQRGNRLQGALQLLPAVLHPALDDGRRPGGQECRLQARGCGSRLSWVTLTG